MKVGDKVRFIYESGGGVVTGFRGKDIVLVEDKDGFEIPMQVRECVVVDTNEYNFVKKTVAPKEEAVAKPKKAQQPAKAVEDDEEDFEPVVSVSILKILAPVPSRRFPSSSSILCVP